MLPLHAGRIPVPRKCQFNNPISAPADWARRRQQRQKEKEEGDEAITADDVDAEACALLVPEAVFYAEDSAAMKGVTTWVDELFPVSFPHRLSLTYPTPAPGEHGDLGGVGKIRGGSQRAAYSPLPLIFSYNIDESSWHRWGAGDRQHLRCGRRS